MKLPLLLQLFLKHARYRILHGYFKEVRREAAQAGVDGSAHRDGDESIL